MKKIQHFTFFFIQPGWSASSPTGYTTAYSPGAMPVGQALP